jgi:vacuolar-type H+-ATPase subunit H
MNSNCITGYHSNPFFPLGNENFKIYKNSSPSLPIFAILYMATIGGICYNNLIIKPTESREDTAMASDTLNAVLTAEKQALQVEADAKLQAEQLQADAQERARGILAAATAEAQGVHKTNAAAIKSRANELEQKAAQQAAAEGEMIKRSAEARRSEAVKAVMHRILSA